MNNILVNCHNLRKNNNPNNLYKKVIQWANLLENPAFQKNGNLF